MIYNENGIILNEDYCIIESLHSYSEFDMIINEGMSDIVNKVGKNAMELIRKMLDGIMQAAEWAERFVKYKKQIDIIKKNRDHIKDIIDSRSIQIKDKAAEYLASTGYGKWIENFENACKKANSQSDITVEEINSILYGNNDKETWFKVNNSSVGKVDADDIIDHAISVANETKSLRKAYSEVKSMNVKIQKDQRLNKEAIKVLHSYLINALSAFKNLSSACIELCVTASKSVKIPGNNVLKLTTSSDYDGKSKINDSEPMPSASGKAHPSSYWM